MRSQFHTPLMLLLRVNWIQTWRRLAAIREQSALLSSIIILFIVGYLGFSFWLFHRALRFMGRFPGFGGLLTERLLFLLFAFLFVLLLLSNLVIGYSNLFRNRETSFLLALPIPAQVIFRWKFIESTLLASWAFLFLIAPLLAAYGLIRGVPWHFYLVTTILTGLFIVLPGVAGSWMAVNLARYMDRRAFQFFVAGLSLACLVGATVWLKPEPISDQMLETRVLAVLDRLLMKTRFAQFPFLPSYWLSSGVLNWSEGALASAGFFSLVLLSHVLFFGFLSFTRMGRLFYDAVSHVQSRCNLMSGWKFFQSRQDQQKQFSFDRGLVERFMSLFTWARPDTRALVVKDLRLFWRDTTQWGQTLILFGLLGAYVINLRHFSQQLTNPFWVNLVSYLNLGACALNLATLTTRFVYPQFSLEGKRLWIVGMAPIGLDRLIKIKFGLASCASLVITLGLISLSCQMLKMPWSRTLYFATAVAIMTFTLNGLAIGLGVLYPNFKEDNPTKIVSGFGGTFCLVLSFLYIAASVVLLAMGSSWSRAGTPTAGSQLATWTGFIILSLALGLAPLKFGLGKAAKFEL